MSSHSSPDNIIETTRYSFWSTVERWHSCGCVDFDHLRYLLHAHLTSAFITSEPGLLHAKYFTHTQVMTNMRRFVVSVLGQLPVHLTFSILQTPSDIIHQNQYSNQTLSRGFELRMILTVHDSCWLTDPRVTAVGVVSVPRLETGRLHRSAWEDWNRPV